MLKYKASKWLLLIIYLRNLLVKNKLGFKLEDEKNNLTEENEKLDEDIKDDDNEKHLTKKEREYVKEKGKISPDDKAEHCYNSKWYVYTKSVK